jgi:sugar-phosphatase
VLITASDIRHGKPAPDAFLLAARRLGVEPPDCIAVEDAPVGVAAGKAAGMRVVAVATTHSAEDLRDADLVVNGPADLQAERHGALITLGIPASPS